MKAWQQCKYMTTNLLLPCQKVLQYFDFVLDVGELRQNTELRFCCCFYFLVGWIAEKYKEFGACMEKMVIRVRHPD